MDACICGLLATKTRVLVTHQLQHLDKANSVIVMEAGSAITQGPIQTLRALASAADAADSAAGDHTTGRLLSEMFAALNAGHAEPVDALSDAILIASSDAKDGTIANTPLPTMENAAELKQTACSSQVVVSNPQSAAATGGGAVTAEGMAEGNIDMSVTIAYFKVQTGLLAVATDAQLKHVPLFAGCWWLDCSRLHHCPLCCWSNTHGYVLCYSCSLVRTAERKAGRTILSCTICW